MDVALSYLGEPHHFSFLSWAWNQTQEGDLPHCVYTAHTEHTMAVVVVNCALGKLLHYVLWRVKIFAKCKGTEQSSFNRDWVRWEDEAILTRQRVEEGCKNGYPNIIQKEFNMHYKWAITYLNLHLIK